MYRQPRGSLLAQSSKFTSSAAHHFGGKILWPVLFSNTACCKSFSSFGPSRFSFVANVRSAWCILAAVVELPSLLNGPKLGNLWSRGWQFEEEWATLNALSVLELYMYCTGLNCAVLLVQCSPTHASTRDPHDYDSEA